MTSAGDQDPAQPKAVVAEWWTMGQNALMDGALAELQSDYKPMYEGAHTHTHTNMHMHVVHALSRHARAAMEGAAESFVRSKVPPAAVAIGAPHVRWRHPC